MYKSGHQPTSKVVGAHDNLCLVCATRRDAMLTIEFVAPCICLLMVGWIRMCKT